jgi:hypothetical protein
VVDLGVETATFQSFPLLGAPVAVPGQRLFPLRERGDAVLRTRDRQYDVIRVEVGAVRWEPPLFAPGTSTLAWLSEFDDERSRVVSLYGVRSTSDLTLDPSVQVVDLFGSRALTAISMSGAPPPPSYLILTEIRWDPVRTRYLVVQPSGSSHGLWSADLAADTWAALVPTGYEVARTIPDARDGDRDRYVGVYAADLTEWSIAPGREGQVRVLPIEGTPGLHAGRTAVATDRAIVAQRGRRLVETSTSADVPTWTALGAIELPIDDGASFAWDATRRRILVYGGSSGFPIVESSALFAIDEAGTAITEIVTTGAQPPGGTAADSLVAGDHLVLVMPEAFGSTIHLLDLATLVWRAAGATTTPFPRLVARPTGLVWIVERGGRVRDLDPVTGASREIDVTGAGPPEHVRFHAAGLRGGLVGVDIDDNDPAGVAVWRLVPTATGACWVPGRADTPVEPLRGPAVTDGERAYFVGSSLYRVSQR